jgi:hypothetical protein
LAGAGVKALTLSKVGSEADQLIVGQLRSFEALVYRAIGLFEF